MRFERNSPQKIVPIINRTSLPSPTTVLHKLGIRPPKRMNQKGFWLIHCSFHKNGKEQHPSLNMHHETGQYRCFACGAKGQDALKFYQTVKNKRFIEALQDFGLGIRR